ncbi:MAG TPA: glycosyltransferase family 2 protein [Acidimicrobiales bacterium]|jgi:glycosyltransferase involved in cell wall biosynthesis
MTAAVDVVLPVLDEAEALPWVLGRIPTGYRAIVVDNGSVDGSAAVARAHGASVVAEPQRGFGAACAAGLAAADAPVVAFCDADASLDPADLPRLVARLDAGEADLVLGARRPTDPGAWPGHARAANRYLAARLRRLTGAPLTDLGPMRAARREPLLALGLADRRFGWPLEMVLRAAAASWRIAEVPVPYARRRGRSKVTGTVRGTARAVRDMRRVLARHSPRPPAPPSTPAGRLSPRRSRSADPAPARPRGRPG